MKKTIPAILLAICMSITATPPISAVVGSAFDDSKGAGTSSLQEIQKIETELLKNGTSVSGEIYKQIQAYTTQLETAEGEEREKLLSLVEKSTALLEKYEQVTLSTVGDGKLVDRKDVLEAAIASVVGFFNMLGYQLSSELLTQMYLNARLDSIYLPINSDRMMQTSTIAEIKKNPLGAGSGVFANEGDEIQRDSYFSLHNFRYVRTDNGTLVITDRYDYSKDDTFGAIQDVPIQLMYEAQEMGLLTPYYVVVIDAPEEGVEDFTSDYIEFKNGVIHIYDGVEDTCCHIRACKETRDARAHEDWDEDGLCDQCGSILDYNFVNVSAGGGIFANISVFFKKMGAKIAKGWRNFIGAMKNFFSFSWLNI